jgi:hypothetical protein
LKVCEVLIGPIYGSDEIFHNEGEEINLEDGTATLFERLTYVRIIGDAIDSSAVAGKAEPEPAIEPEPEVSPTRKSKAAASKEVAE